MVRRNKVGWNISPICVYGRPNRPHYGSYSSVRLLRCVHIDTSARHYSQEDMCIIGKEEEEESNAITGYL